MYYIKCICGAKCRNTSKERGRFLKRHRDCLTPEAHDPTWSAEHLRWRAEHDERQRQREVRRLISIGMLEKTAREMVYGKPEEPKNEHV